MIIETFTDYLEHYYEENEQAVDVKDMIDHHFEEFAVWAWEDLVITEEDRNILLDPGEWKLRQVIKRIIVNEFLLILDS